MEKALPDDILAEPTPTQADVEAVQVEGVDCQQISSHLTTALMFSEMRHGEELISSPLQGTFEWALASSQFNDLPNWLESGNGLFWITGKPGSGKSTLMKFLAQDQRTHALLRRWSDDRPCFVVTHFLSYSTTSLGRSKEGLLRSMLHQMLSFVPEVMDTAFPTQTTETEDFRWRLDELEGAFFRIVSSHTTSRFCFFIDALDECEGDISELIGLMKQATSSSVIKICVSGRPRNVLEDAFQLRSLRMENFTRQDIITYLQVTLLDGNEDVRQSVSTHRINGLNVVETLSNQATGMFLWVKLVANRLLESKSTNDWASYINEPPASLKELYETMLVSSLIFQRRRQRRFLRVAASTINPLPLIIYWFVDEDLQRTHQGGKTGYLEPKQLSSEYFLACEAVARRRLFSSCGGLLEIQSQDNHNYHSMSARVSWIHHSAREYYRERCRSSRKTVSGSEEIIHRAYVALVGSLPIPRRPTIQSNLLASLLRGLTSPEPSSSAQNFTRLITSTQDLARIVLKSWLKLDTSKGLDEEDDPEVMVTRTDDLNFGLDNSSLIAIRYGLNDIKWDGHSRLVLDLLIDQALTLSGGDTATARPHNELKITKYFLNGEGRAARYTSGRAAGPTTPSSQQNSEPTFYEPSQTTRTDELTSAVRGAEGTSETFDSGSSGTYNLSFMDSSSIFSESNDPSTASESGSMDFTKTPREALVEFLLEDIELYPLLAAGASEGCLGLPTLTKAFHGLMHRYANELLSTAKTQMEKEVARFVRGNLNYVSYGVRVRFESCQNHEMMHVAALATHPRHGRGGSLTEERLNQHLKALHEGAFIEGLEAQKLSDLVPHQKTDMVSDRESGGMENLSETTNEPPETTFDEDTIYSVFDQAREFLELGSPMRNLRDGLRQVVLSKPLGGDDSPSTISADNTPGANIEEESNYFTTINQRLSQVEQVYNSSLAFLLDELAAKITFPFFEAHIPPGMIRLRWQCKCGAQDYDDFIKLDLESGNPDDVVPETNTSLNRLPPFHVMWQTLLSILKALYGWTTSLVTKSHTMAPETELQECFSKTEPSQPLLRLLMCIDEGSTRTTLYQELLVNCSDDQSLFKLLRKRYFQIRRIKTWFTLRSVGRLSLTRFQVDCSKFAEVHKHFDRCSDQGCICLPPKEKVIGNLAEYKCAPAPNEPAPQAPAIGSRRLTHYFKSPDCVQPQTTIYDQLPKRLQGDLIASQSQEMQGWGIHFEEGWHWPTIYLIILGFIFSFSLVFAIVWSVKKADIQGAFAISSFWITLGGILMGYLAIKSE